ncbi:MAG: hypothetical protein ACPGTU_13550 [Myxococcota bacterium]
MMRSASIICLTLSGFGCAPECVQQDPISGDWRISTAIQTPDQALRGDNTDQHPMEAHPLLANTQTWTILSPRDSFIEISVGSELHAGTYTVDPEDCEAFTLELRSTTRVQDFDAAGEIRTDTDHDFLWKGELRYSGPRLTGTFSYQDDWVSNIDSEQGSIVIGQIDFLASPLN